MKITKDPNKPSVFEMNKINANNGCNNCPRCGETRDFILEGNGIKGISQGTYRTYIEGFFKMKSMRVDCYTCHTCGCEWESDPYQWC